jgi:uncharacterized protein YbjQ (UPF0145 family)
MFEFALFVISLVGGYIIGTIVEKRHFKSLQAREEASVTLPIVMLKKPLHEESVVETKLVHGSVVISIDFFKKFIASLVNFFGGSVSTYETLLDRARREAVLRLKEDAQGASEVVNLRIETTAISKTTKKAVGSVEVFAYATAVYR